jgi:hypothetical protein
MIEGHWVIDDGTVIWWEFGSGEAMEPQEALRNHPDNQQFDAAYDALVALLSARTVRPEDIPVEIKALIDERAGREHSADGPVMTTTAEVLTLWEKHKVGGV